MTAELLAEHADARVYHADWRALLDLMPRRADGTVADCLITDTPYSERTHGSYRDMAEVGRSPIGYAAWSASDVEDFVASWAPAITGWFVTLTDHVLVPAWESALQAAGRYVFAPLSCMEPGSRVRLSGDGPAQWSVHAVVARPKTRVAQQWGALPGGYVVPSIAGWRGSMEGRSGVVGGKPLWLMERLVEDYSRPGDLVVDPCAGAFTTGVACQRTGRRFVGGDILLEHAQIGAKRISRMVQAPLFLAGGAT